MPRRSTPVGQVRVYAYAFYPTEISAPLEDQFRLATAMWNTFVAFEETVDQRYEALWRSIPAVAELMDTLAEYRTTGERSPEYGRLARQLADTKRQHHRAMASNLQAFWAEVAIERRQRIKAIRQQFAAQGLRYGTYNDVIRRYNQARQRVWTARRQGISAAMRPQRADGTGSLTFQAVPQVGKPPLTWTTLTQPGKHPFGKEVQMEAPRIEDLQTRSGRRHHNRHAIQVRMASTPDHAPIWLKGHVALHRLWPEDGVITTIRWVRRKVGFTWRHTLQFTVRLPESPVVTVSEGAPRIGLVVGERPTDHGTRVAVWAASTGDEMVTLDSVERINAWDGSQGGELVLPPRFDQAWDRVQALIHERAQGRQDAQKVLIAGLKIQALSSDPEFQRLANLAAEPGRAGGAALVQLVRYWRHHRWANDNDTERYTVLEQWRRRDKLLATELAHLRDKTVRSRRELYRVFAKRVATLYGAVVLSSEPVGSGLTRSSEGSHVALFQLRSEIAWALQKQGRTVTTVTTIRQLCPNGHPLTADTKEGFVEAATCPTCGWNGDRDFARAHALIVDLE